VKISVRAMSGLSAIARKLLHPVLDKPRHVRLAGGIFPDLRAAPITRRKRRGDGLDRCVEVVGSMAL
jgi:hypothetical protein